MDLSLQLCPRTNKGNSLVVFVSNEQKDWSKNFTKSEACYAKGQLKLNIPIVVISRAATSILVVQESAHDNVFTQLEKCRKSGNIVLEKLKELKISIIDVVDESKNGNSFSAFLEGLLLSNYSFTKYFSDKKNLYWLETVNVISDAITSNILEQIEITTQATFFARDLVNEPFSFLTTQQLSKEIGKAGKEAGFTVEVFTKAKIESLKMGGLLAVNKGSIDPPAFNILTWKPKKCVNKKPLILVGKGVVYDTGGLSLKPTENSMDHMKCDMGGAASVAGAMYAISKAKLPVHVIGLIPATDNRPSGNAYAPGDVITMFDGTTVEVLNTDAEGRLILADAISYALKHEPELIIDVATLTGAALGAVGTFAIASMTNNQVKHDCLANAGNNTYERLAQLPMWEEYGDLIKSPIADIKNLGGSFAGAITAGKFLEHFVKKQDWIHLDIAGPAYSDCVDSYRGKGASGVGVRLLFDFVKQRCNE